MIESEADIGRSPEDVFDYCSDLMNEPQWNVRMKGVEKVTDGPFGLGTRYRIGYFGSTLPERATPADQADAYALLLDHLGVDRAVAIGFSAGKRVHPRVRGASSPARHRSDPRLLPPRRRGHRRPSLRTGVSPRLQRGPAVLGVQEREQLFPFKPRRDGAVFDGFVANLAADRFLFEQLTVPTLVISARDDALAPYRFAANAAARIPGSKLVTIEAGGHLFMGHDAQVREAIRAFAQELT